MKKIANIFIILFLLDGGLSLTDEILTIGWGLNFLYPIRIGIAIIVFLSAFLMYLFMGIDARLPKKIFIPAVFAVVWGNLYAVPLPFYFDSTAMLIASGIQVIIGCYILIVVRKTTGSHWLLTEDLFYDPMFSGKNTVLFFSGNLIFLPIVIVLYLYMTLYCVTDQITAGFMRLRPTGIYLQDREYQNGDKTIRLIGMIHMGEKKYYRNLSQSLSAPKTIILAEGVTDSKNVLSNFHNVTKLAKYCGLSYQDEMQLNGKLMHIADLNDDISIDGKNSAPIVAIADIDASEFSSDTIAFLNGIGALIEKSASLSDLAASYVKWVTETGDQYDDELLFDDILDKRNDLLIVNTEKALIKFDTIIIPWGAMHMPAIEAAILDQGYSRKSCKERLSIDFSKLKFKPSKPEIS